MLRGRREKPQGESRIRAYREPLPLIENRNPSGLVTLVLAEFVPQLLLQKCTRIYFPFCNVLVCFMQGFLHRYEELAARNFRFKVTPGHNARRHFSLEQT